MSTDTTDDRRAYVRAVESSSARAPADVRQQLLDQLGGPWGMVYATVPVVVFAAAVPFFALPVTVAIAIGVAVVFAGVRLVRGEKLLAAWSGVFGVVAAGGIAAWTGSASDFFLIGIVAALAGAVVTLVSLVVRRPLSGVVWNAVHGGGHAWRADRPSLRAHDIATAAVAVVFTVRFVVKEWLYLENATGWLAFAKIATGTPLTVLAALVVVWAFRRSTKRLVKQERVTE